MYNALGMQQSKLAQNPEFRDKEKSKYPKKEKTRIYYRQPLIDTKK
jgi:hypothetical protein